MKYDEAIRYLYALQKHGIKLGLDNTIRLLSLLGNPQASFRSIHVAGTNGKGSTSAMIASILREAGFKVGLFTSPHIVSFTERIRVDGVEIKEQEVVGLAEEIREIIEHSQWSDRSPSSAPSLAGGGGFLPTFFEFVTSMAFLYFMREGVEWAVVETGMGGRLDATNILNPRVSVITHISYDHREFLGETLREIAGEKAGIIKSGVPVVSSAQPPDALGVIMGKASENGSALFLAGRDFFFRLEESDMQGITFHYKGVKTYDGLYVPLCGTHQAENASLALRAVEVLMNEVAVSPQSVRDGFALTAWQGRLELIRKGESRYDLLIDGAHNADASRALADSLTRFFVPSYGRIILVLGIMADKDIPGIMRPLLPIASEIIFASPDYARAASPEKLSEHARMLGHRSTVARSVKEAIHEAIRKTEDLPESDRRDLIVITGSFYTIGEAKMALGHRGVLASLRE